MTDRPVSANPMIGRSTPRLEDRRLLTGAGRFVEDLAPPPALGPALTGLVVRSPVAHGRIVTIERAEAEAIPGVVRVYTGADLDALGVVPLPCITPVDSADGTPFHAPERFPLARETVRFVGDPVAFVVAESLAAARDAADALFVDYEELAATVDPLAAEEVGFVWEDGDRAATEAAFAAAAQIVSLDGVVNNRIVITPIETRSALGWSDPDTGALVLETQTQGVHLVRRLVARTLGIEEAELRVVTRDVGGSFGMKIMNYPEHTLTLAAARDLGRPVRWVSDRTEAFLTDAHGRDQVSRAELALDADGRILALRCETVGNIGAYASAIGPMILSKGFAKTLGHCYRVPTLHLTVRGVYTNTAPTDAYRGAGKPESEYLVERLVEKAARLRGEDPVAFRRRNLLPPEAMPYKAANGFTYDSADFPGAMERAVAASDRAGFAARRAESEARGLTRGWGIGLYLHLTGGDPAESSEVLLEADGTVTVLTGVQASGQGHETAFAQLVAGRLEIPVERVRVVEGDSARIARGGGTGGSSSLPIAATTIARATDAMLDRARELAADALEAAPEDLVYGDGGFTIAGTDRRLALPDLAARLAERATAGQEGGEEAARCAGLVDCEGETQTVPHGAYVAEVEVDPATGVVRLDRFTAVDDLGVRLNPMIAEGQIHGGLAQGIGQALMERTVYDSESGQMLSASLMDYRLPRADDLPDFDLHAADHPTAANPLGMKGAGEVGCIGAPAAVINAVCDALDLDHMDMPATPERVWRALQASHGASD
ncbi:MAG: xanthine dehydrogenase family protein molybdopterin-binding subunit [Alphaproteobacteria bacterium]|nr:xanthine dehydrogenase family protein molybdopterin-binding subunit [Alphaproteobacteria bacterium]